MEEGSRLSTEDVTDQPHMQQEILRLREEVFKAENVLREKTELIHKQTNKLQKYKSERNPITTQSHFKEAFVKFVTNIPGHSKASYALFEVLAKLLNFTQDDIDQIEEQRKNSSKVEGKGLLSLFGL